VTARSKGSVRPSHKIHLRHTDDGVPIASLDAGEALPNKDFVLTWRAGDVGVRPWLRFERDEGRPGTFLLMLTPSVPRTHTEGVGGDGDAKAVRCGNCGGVIRDLSAIKEIPGLGPVIPCAFCGAILAPGTEVITRATRPRDLLILVDRSASMRGAMPAAARAVRALLDGMGPGDGAQLMAFDHDRLAFDGDGERFAVISPELTQMAERFMATLTPPRGYGARRGPHPRVEGPCARGTYARRGADHRRRRGQRGEAAAPRARAPRRVDPALRAGPRTRGGPSSRRAPRPRGRRRVGRGAPGRHRPRGLHPASPARCARAARCSPT
jgi:hypothetical protein